MQQKPVETYNVYIIKNGGPLHLIYRSGRAIVNWGRSRIPTSYEMFGLYATIVFLIYGWTTIAFFWKLPSWLFMLNASEIALSVAYVLISDLLESLLVLVIFIAACFVLPPRWLRDDFAVRGSLIMYAVTFWTCLFTLNSLIGLPTRSELLLIVLGLFASIGVIVVLVKRNSAIGRFTRDISERLTIFLYVWIPLSLLAFLVVVVRALGRMVGVL